MKEREAKKLVQEVIVEGKHHRFLAALVELLFLQPLCVDFSSRAHFVMIMEGLCQQARAFSQ